MTDKARTEIVSPPIVQLTLVGDFAVTEFWFEERPGRLLALDVGLARPRPLGPLLVVGRGAREFPPRLTDSFPEFWRGARGWLGLVTSSFSAIVSIMPQRGTESVKGTHSAAKCNKDYVHSPNPRDTFAMPSQRPHDKPRGWSQTALKTPVREP